MLRRRPEPGLIETVALGLLQGPAELLPISSSAHVELLPWALRWRHASLPAERRKEVEVALHAGTALALAAARGPAALRRPALLALSTAPPALAGLLFERAIERRLGTPLAIAGGLVAGSVALVLCDLAAGRRRAADAGPADALWLGAAQAAALLPGVSRSGAALAAGRARGFARRDAAELSDEVALPVLAGAAVLKGLRLVQRRGAGGVLAAGAGAAAASTLAALRLERRRVPLWIWAAYRAGIAAAVLLVRENRRR